VALASVDCEERGQRWLLASYRANTSRDKIAALVPPIPCSAGQGVAWRRRGGVVRIDYIALPRDCLDPNFASSSRCYHVWQW
jgi:hypothetical protein